MSPSFAKPAALLSVLAIAAGVAGCGAGDPVSHYVSGVDAGQLRGHQVADGDNDGAYVEAGNVTYQLQLSRQLNPWGVEDSQYIQGLPKGMSRTRLPADELWYGVFLWAKDQHHRTVITPAANRFEIVDTIGDVYHPIPLNWRLNPYAWTQEHLQYGMTVPGQDTTAAQGFTGGKLLLFKLNTSIYDNRPLTLFILGNTGRKIAEISLDL